MKTDRKVIACFWSVALLLSAGFAAAQKGKKPPGPPPPPADPAIAYVAIKGTDKSLMVMNGDGTNRVSLFSARRLSLYGPTWSPDGKQLAFVMGPLLTGGASYVINVDGSGLHEIPNLPGDSLTELAWAPYPVGSGSLELAYRLQLDVGHPQGDVGDIFLADLSGMQTVNCTNTPDWDEFRPSWSPDGSKLAVMAYDMTKFQGGSAPIPDLLIYQLVPDMNGNPSCVLLSNLTADGTPFSELHIYKLSWSKDPLQPDLLAVSARFEGATHDIWVVNPYDDSSFHNLTNTDSSEETEMSWSPDNSQIVFEDAAGLWTIGADGTGRTLLVGAEKSNGEPRWPDGRRNP